MHQLQECTIDSMQI